MNKYIRKIASATSLVLAFLLFPSYSYSQVPKGIPKSTGPVDLSETSSVIIYVVIPAVVIIAFLIFRKRIKKVKEDKKERLNNKK